MTAYQVRWVESWTRTLTVDLDEDSLREWADVPTGPMPESLIRTYIEESTCGEIKEWPPKTTPGMDRKDEFDSLDVIWVEPVEKSVT